MTVLFNYTLYLTPNLKERGEDFVTEKWNLTVN